MNSMSRRGKGSRQKVCFSLHEKAHQVQNLTEHLLNMTDFFALLRDDIDNGHWELYIM